MFNLTFNGQYNDAEPATEERALSTWAGASFEILGPDDAAFSGSGYAFACFAYSDCSDSADSAAAELTALDRLEFYTAFAQPLERTVTPGTTGRTGYIAGAACLAAEAAIATATACLDAY